MKSRQEIEDKLGDAYAASDEAEAEGMNSKFHGSTYEEGVQAALNWVLGNADDPMEE